MNKKGLFFIIDIVLALIVLVVGFVLIYASAIGGQSTLSAGFAANDAITQLDQTQFFEVDNLEVQNAFLYGFVTEADFEKSLLQIIAQLYYSQDSKQIDLARNITELQFTNVGFQFDWEFYLDNVLLTNNSRETAFDDSQVVVVQDAIVMTLLQNGTLIGPLIAEVRVWQ
ncbi:MAG: hypothetical protein ACI8Y7_000506 [Candidatus Woesearchaeota archaeon]|jgi:hypothetical protein